MPTALCFSRLHREILHAVGRKHTHWARENVPFGQWTPEDGPTHAPRTTCNVENGTALWYAVKTARYCALQVIHCDARSDKLMPCVPFRGFPSVKLICMRPAWPKIHAGIAFAVTLNSQRSAFFSVTSLITNVLVLVCFSWATLSTRAFFFRTFSCGWRLC